MIDAYYSLGSDSSKLFEDTRIASDPDYEKYRNKYNVIHLDISSFFDDYKVNLIEKIVEYIYDDITDELGDTLDYKKKLSYVLMKIYEKTEIPFVIIIDEWDCVIRNSNDQALVHKYLQFLHSLFKSEESKSFLALGYITGILPIKKIKDESALNNFQEYSDDIDKIFPVLKEYIICWLNIGEYHKSLECNKNILEILKNKLIGATKKCIFNFIIVVPWHITTLIWLMMLLNKMIWH